MKCHLHGGQAPQEALDIQLVCEHCSARLPASTALCSEGSDYVRHFCGEGCLAEWCEQTQQPPPKR
jgi:hypothetical protein